MNNTSYIHYIKINKRRKLFVNSDTVNLHNFTINFYISLKDDFNKNNQFLFWINTHNYKDKLFYFNDDKNIYYFWNFKNFLNP